MPDDNATVSYWRFLLVFGFRLYRCLGQNSITVVESGALVSVTAAHKAEELPGMGGGAVSTLYRTTSTMATAMTVQTLP